MAIAEFAEVSLAAVVVLVVLVVLQVEVAKSAIVVVSLKGFDPFPITES